MRVWDFEIVNHVEILGGDIFKDLKLVSINRTGQEKGSTYKLVEKRGF